MKHILTLSLFALWATVLFVTCTGEQKPEQTATDKQAHFDSLKLEHVLSAQKPEEWHCVPIAPLPELKRAVGMRGKFWPVGATIKVGFIGGTETQKNTVKQGFSNWKQPANLNFEYPQTGPYDVRVGFNPGSAWSYIGVDAKQIDQSKPTLNWGHGNLATVLHEAGHLLGLAHEQQYPNGICWNEANVIADLSGSPNWWNLQTIRFNVLDYHNPANVITNSYDQKSIMHYAIKASWTCDGKAIPGGTVISELDRAFVSDRYPYPVTPQNITITKAQRDNIYRLQQKAKLYADSALIISKSAFGL